VLATLAIVVPVEAQLEELAADGFSVLLRESPAEDIMVFASPPCNACKSYCSIFSFIGLLPAPDECVSHITRPYLKKPKEPKKLKRNRRVALAGSPIVIRAWQQVEGWECRGQM
jgi:hypothetical protein